MLVQLVIENVWRSRFSSNPEQLFPFWQLESCSLVPAWITSAANGGDSFLAPLPSDHREQLMLILPDFHTHGDSNRTGKRDVKNKRCVSRNKLIHSTGHIWYLMNPWAGKVSGRTVFSVGDIAAWKQNSFMFTGLLSSNQIKCWKNTALHRKA